MYWIVINTIYYQEVVWNYNYARQDGINYNVSSLRYLYR